MQALQDRKVEDIGMKYFDVIVIGGGPSGLMAAIAAGEQGADVLLIDKGNKLGRKLAISGGGRCNVTNRLPVDEIIRHIPGNGRFLYSAFSEFNNEDIIKFFERLGVKLKEEDHGRMFPVSDKAQSVVDALLTRLEQLHVSVRTNEKVKTVLYNEEKAFGIVTGSGEEIAAGSVVIAVGGKSVPHTGSTGDGYEWAEKAGHTITELFPTEVPVTSDEPFINEKRRPQRIEQKRKAGHHPPNGYDFYPFWTVRTRSPQMQPICRQRVEKAGKSQAENRLVP